MTLLETFASLLQGWGAVFSQQRTLDRARRMALALLISVRVHRTSNAICVTGRQFLDWSADYRLFSRSKWDPHALFQVVIDHLPGLLASKQAPIFAALDDTILKKTSRNIPGVKVLRDPMSPPFRVNFC